jgi:hypothetical protein
MWPVGVIAEEALTDHVPEAFPASLGDGFDGGGDPRSLQD